MPTREEMDAFVSGIAGGASKSEADQSNSGAQATVHPEPEPADIGVEVGGAEIIAIPVQTDDWMAENDYYWYDDNYIHSCPDCDPNADPPIIHCPVCGEAIELTPETWHNGDCQPRGHIETEEEWFERIYGGIQWSVSKNGNHYGKHNGMVMFIKENKSMGTFSACANLEDSDSKRPLIPWSKARLTSLIQAKEYIVSRVDEAKAVKMF